MGVHGSHCQLCRLPLQHDHYVPTEILGMQMLKIYRGSSPNGGHTWEPGERVVRFGPEHAWLEDVVLVSHEGQVLLAGRVEDGALRDGTGRMAFEDEGTCFHRACWERGEGTTGGGFEWARIEAYDGQLFEMWDFVAHHHGWALEDPARNERSRARIDAIIAHARRAPQRDGQPRTVADVIAADRGWGGTMTRDPDGNARFAIRYRNDTHRELDLATYPTLVWAMVEYDGGGMPPTATCAAQLLAFESAAKAAVEAGAAAIVVVTTVGEGQLQLLAQARDEAATRAAIEAIPRGDELRPVDFDNEADPTWAMYFEQMDPRGRAY